MKLKKMRNTSKAMKNKLTKNRTPERNIEKNMMPHINRDLTEKSAIILYQRIFIIFNYLIQK